MDKIEPSLAEIKSDQIHIALGLNDLAIGLSDIATRLKGISARQIEQLDRVEKIAPSFEHLHLALVRLESRVERIRRETEFNRHHRNAYLGGGVSVVWLPDDTIMYVNSNDEGGPAALISGGRYEEEYFSVFQSFLSSTSIVLDIGANLGIYSLKTAQFFRNSPGKVIAFEPHPLAFDLFQRSINHNGLGHQIDAQRVALSNQAGETTLFYPERHIGGGGYLTERENSSAVRAKLEVLDDLLPSQKIDLVKIDVEGNEYSVLSGMTSVIARSLNIAILFEKLQIQAPEDQKQYRLLTEFGLGIYAVDSGSRLRLLDLASYVAFAGYALAARSHVVGNDLDRRFFNIGWQQLTFPDSANNSASSVECSASAHPGKMLFHGPYWYLAKGRYRLSILGDLNQPIVINITEQFGVEITRFDVSPATMEGEFEVPYDLRKFECIARAGLEPVQITIRLLRFQRI